MLDQLFAVGIWLKAFDGVLEIGGGLLLLTLFDIGMLGLTWREYTLLTR
ncbi:MAG TPA: hypothetical protein VKE41_02995 [Roseiflexaceae bacterium]|nr:hypothetical protein [Roseiflexaceae bacterium]